MARCHLPLWAFAVWLLILLLQVNRPAVTKKGGGVHAGGPLILLLDREGANQKTVAPGINTHRIGLHFALQTGLDVPRADF